MVTSQKLNRVARHSSLVQQPQNGLGNFCGRRRGFPNDRVAVNQGWSNFPDGDGHRVVPRRNDGDDPDRWMAHRAGGLARLHLKVRGAANHVADVSRRATDFFQSVRNRFADFNGHLPRQNRRGGLQLFCNFSEQWLSRRGRASFPIFPGAFCRACREFNFTCAGNWRFK